MASINALLERHDKAAGLFALVLVMLVRIATAAPPPDVMKELTSGNLRMIGRRVDDIGPELRAALAKTFHQRRLELGNPNAAIGGAVTYTGDPARSAPYRRLIFAFKTLNYAFVYYESGDPELSASCLVFDAQVQNEPRLVWGGADLKRPFARNPSELRIRIRNGKLFDDHPYVW